MPESLDEFIGRTAELRGRYPLPLQARRRAEELAHAVLGVMFPHFAPWPGGTQDQVRTDLQHVREQLDAFLCAQGDTEESAARRSGAFLDALPGLTEDLGHDARALHETDPAAHSVDEVILAYPGFLALACYRIAHVLLRAGVELLPRLITETAHRETGIDIHPGAAIGRALAIDHGTGVVIGETTVIGSGVRVYQGVTLGALSVRKDAGARKRHPTIEDDVVIYAGATILGGDTVIGRGSVIGGNVWLTHSVPPGSVVTHGAVIERPRQAAEHVLEFNI